MIYSLSFLFALNLALLASAAPLEDEPNEAEAARDAVLRANQFTFDLFRAAAADRERNELISGYGVREVLSLAALGARGETREELLSVLRLPEDPLREANELAAVRSSLQSAADSGTVLNVANALWVDSTLPLRENFLESASQLGRAQVKSISLRSRRSAVLEINRWASEQTKGRIPQIIDAGDVGSDTVCLMTNAIYFFGKWQAPFDAKKTKPAPFHVRENVAPQVPTMHGRVFCRSGMVEESGLQIAELPYRGKRLSMVLLLPADRKEGLAELEASLAAGAFDDWMRHLHQNTVNISLPKFKFSADHNLAEPLKSMGISRSFDKSRADFSGIAEGPLWLQNVAQKTYIDVHETGTEAAAVTRGGVGGGVREIESFAADRPFLFVLRDAETGCALFVGRVANPLEK